MMVKIINEFSLNAPAITANTAREVRASEYFSDEQKELIKKFNQQKLSAVPMAPEPAAKKIIDRIILQDKQLLSPPLENIIFSNSELKKMEDDLVTELVIDEITTNLILENDIDEEYPPMSVQAQTIFGDVVPSSTYTAISNRFFAAMGFHLDRDGLDKSLMSNYVNIPKEADVFVKLGEDVGILVYSMIRSRNAMDRMVAISTYCKLRGSYLDMTTLLTMAFSRLFQLAVDTQVTSVTGKLEIQSKDIVDQLDDARKYIDCYDKLKVLPIFVKLYKFGMYALSFSIFDKVGINFNTFNYNKLEAEAVKRNYHLGPDFVHTILDTTVFLCRQGIQCMRTGSLDPIFHSGTEYEEWYTIVARLKREAPFLNNPEPHNINTFKFLSDLFSAIEKGEAIRKFGVNMDKFEKKNVEMLLNDLLIIKATELTKKAALEDRKAPFAILLFGGSSVGKSSIKNAMFCYYGKRFLLPTKPEFMYTRDPNNPYWSGFNSTQWCVVLDDIGFLKPNGAPDPSLMEMLQINNNIAFVPVQADLADKGKTPLRNELLIATTNTEHLNVSAYFSCPLAISRRFPYVVTVVPKKEYNINGMLDTAKLPRVKSGEMPDFWNFTVKKTMACKDDGQRAELVVVERFDNINDYLCWYGDAADTHKRNQDKAKDCTDAMFDIELCDRCHSIESVCDCPRQMCRICKELSTNCECIGDFYVNYPPDVMAQCPQCPGKVNDCASDCFFKPIIIQLLLEYAECANDDDASRQSIIERVQEMHNESQRDFLPIQTFNETVIDKFNNVKEEIVESWEQTLENMSGYFCIKCFNKVDHFCPWVKEDLLFFGDGTNTTVAERDDEIYHAESPWYQFKLWLFSKILLFSEYWIVGLIFEFLFGMYWKQRLGWKLLGELRTMRVIFKCLGNRMANKMCNDDRIIRFLAFVTVSGPLIYTIIKLVKLWTKPEVQGSQISKEKIPVPRANERENVWHAKEHDVTSFHISRQSVSANICDFQDNLNKLSSNCVTFILTSKHGSKNTTRVNNAVCIGGSTYLLNNHGVFAEGDFHINVVDVKDEGLVPNNTFLVTQSQVERFPEKDIAILELRNLIPKKNIKNLFPLKPLEGKFKGSYIVKSRVGGHKFIDVKAIHVVENYDTALGKMRSLIGNVTDATANGDCGSLLVLNTELGPVLGGIHIMGQDSLVGTIPLCQDDIKNFTSHLRPSIQCGEPVISSASAPRNIGPLHSKAYSSYIEKGVGMIYGSFKGFRPRHKSGVELSMLCPQYQQLGYEVKYCAPQMEGWEPWRIALLDMVQPVTELRQDVIDHCVIAFTHDILSNISIDELDTVHVIDDFTAANGAAGVAYVDCMKRGTSMGNPWKTSKRHFMNSIPPRGFNLDPIEFTPEVMDRVRDCERKYLANTRYMPVYNANLKDEPVTFKKKKDCKTRVFMGAPVEFTFVERKYLLCISRLIQNNRILFESGPGTVAQSIEWQELHDHITQFGKDRMVAGDYKAFDKKMPASLILAAFDIIYNICEAAGYNDDELKMVRGIASDVAYPLVDFDGELLQFAGSNPSGHSLTVIINGLVNCLYMRYCYCILGDGTCWEFKKDVALFTYGDDNVMGVRRDVDWFNHTTIQRTLGSVGIVYTMADKIAESEPFIHIDNVSFLKRTFRLDDDIGAIVCPLEHDSIEKSLMINVRSKCMTPEDQTIEAMGGSLREYFWYGKNTFDMRKSMFLKLIKSNGLQPYVENNPLPSWDELVKKFWISSGSP